MTMDFDGHILVRSTGWGYLTEWIEKAGTKIPLRPSSQEDLEDSVAEAMEFYIDEVGRGWLRQFSETQTHRTCPFADVELPADIWICEVTEKKCPIGAWIHIENKQKFIEGCDVEKASFADRFNQSSQEFKNNVWDVVVKGEFSGAHHNIGQFLCVFCNDVMEKRSSYFPWELTRISDHLDDPSEFHRSIAVEAFNPPRKMGQAICAQCFIDLEKTYSDIDFHSYGIDFEEYQVVPYEFTY